MAIQAYKDRKIKSILKAAKVYAVSEKTLHARFKERKPCTEIRANSHKLTKIEEQLLLK